eukprot:s1301_g8.t1
MSFIVRGRRSTLDASIVIFPGMRSTLDVSCCVFFANCIVRAASSGENAQIVWQEWHFLTGDGPPLPQNRSSRSRERVEEDKRPKTKRRKVPYVTFEELRWDWLKSQSPEVPAETAVDELDLLQALKAPQTSVPSELPWDTDLMVELDEVAPPPAPPPAPPAPSKPTEPAPLSLPWDAELMVELEEAPAEEAPAPAAMVKPKPQAEIEESYLVDGLTEEDLFDVDDEEAAAEYMPPVSPKMKAKKPPSMTTEPPSAETSKAPGAPAASAPGAKNKKKLGLCFTRQSFGILRKDWYQRHYPGQVAPREPTDGRRFQRPPPRQNGYKPPGQRSATAPRPQELDWAYEPLKAENFGEKSGGKSVIFFNQNWV